MTINEKIEFIKPKINFNFNKAIQETLYPFDNFVKKATEEALIEIGSKVRIIEKSVFIPVYSNIRYYNVLLSNLSKTKFDVSQPKDLTLVRSDGATYNFDTTFIENIIHNRFDTLLTFAFKTLGSNLDLRQSVNVDNFTAQGNFDTITTVNLANVISIGDVNNATEKYYIINLESADVGLYDYRIITDITGAALTLDSRIDNPPAWVVGGKVYIASTLPYMLLFTFQGVIQPGYFNTETTIPIANQFLPDLDNIIIRNLFRYLSSRFPEQAKIYAEMLRSGLLKSVDQTITDIKLRANSKIDNPVVQLYSPFTNYYGR